MRDIAKDAGVAVETVYANFGSKTELLMTAIDVGVVGDAEPVATVAASGVRRAGHSAASPTGSMRRPG